MGGLQKKKGRIETLGVLAPPLRVYDGGRLLLDRDLGADADLAHIVGGEDDALEVGQPVVTLG